MKKGSITVFFIIVFAVYFSINFYIYMKGRSALPETPAVKLIYTIFFATFSLLYIAGRFAERISLNKLTSFMVRTGGIWLASMVYFLLIVIVIDILTGINRLFNLIPETIYYDTDTKIGVFIGSIILTGAVTIAGYINAKRIKVKELFIKIYKEGGKQKKFRIAAASDIHLGTIVTKDRLERIVKLINLSKPDIVLLPGDVIDEDIKPVIKENLGELIRNMKSKYGVFSVTGNHEHIGGVDEACNYLIEHGVIMLRDEKILIDDSFYLVGREDRSVKHFKEVRRKKLCDIIDGIDNKLPIIVLDHQPIRLNEAADCMVDLQLSGHTHHGQLWPFNIITSKLFEISWGYKMIGNTHFYVSCGAGTWGPPVRTGNSPEILYIDVIVDEKKQMVS